MEPAKTQEEKEARIKAAIEARGIKPGTEDYNTWYGIYDKKIQVVPPAATAPSPVAAPTQPPVGTITAAPSPATKPTATAEQWREEANKKVAETYGLRLSFVRGLSDQTILNDYPEAKTVRGSYTVVPNAEKNPSPVSSINAGAAASKEESMARQASVARYDRSQGFDEQGPFLGEPTETQLSAAGNPDILYPANDIIPVEYRTSFDAMGPGWRDAFSPQTSLGAPPSSVNTIKPQPTPIMENDVDTDAALRQASQDALVQLREYLTQNNPEYKNGTEDQRALILYREMRGLVDPPTIKQGALGEDEATKEERDINATFFRTKEDSSAPDYTPAQMYYISSFRSSLANQFKNQGGMNRVNELIGSPQWYENEGMKRQVLAASPEYYGVLGLGNYVYPSGATRESTGMYAMRMAAAPANFVVGGLTSLVASALPEEAEASIRTAREQSEITPAGSFPNAEGAWERSVATALDNVKRNRGATEEIYDFGVGVGGIEHPYAKSALFGVGLLTDIVAVPIVPGASAAVELVSGTGAAAKAAARGATVATKGERVAAVIENLVPDPLPYLARKAGLTEAPGDIRLLSAQGYMSKTDAINNAANEVSRLERSLATGTLSGDELAAATRQLEEARSALQRASNELPASLAGELNEARAIVRAAIDGDAAALTNRSLARWVQTAIGVDSDLAARASAVLKKSEEAKGVTGVGRLFGRMSGEPDFLDAVLRAMQADVITRSMIKADAEAGAGTLHLLTPRVAVANADRAKQIMKEASEHPIARVLKKGSLNEEDINKVFDYLKSKSDLSSFGRGSDRFFDSARSELTGASVAIEEPRRIAAAKGVDAPKAELVTLTPQTIRTVLDLVVNDVALSGKNVKNLAADVEELGRQGVKLGIFTPHEVRPSLFVRFVDEMKAKFQKEIPLSDKAGLLIEQAKQELGALPGALNRDISALAKERNISRPQAIMHMMSARIVSAPNDAADSIIGFVRWGEASTFSGLFTASKNVLSTPVGAALMKEAEDTLRASLKELQTDLGKVRNVDAAGRAVDYATLERIVTRYIDDVQKVVDEKGLRVGVATHKDVPEIIVATLLDARARRILDLKSEELFKAEHLKIDSRIIREGREAARAAVARERIPVDARALDAADATWAEETVSRILSLRIQRKWKSIEIFMEETLEEGGRLFERTMTESEIRMFYHLDEIAEDIYVKGGFNMLTAQHELEAALSGLASALKDPKGGIVGLYGSGVADANAVLRGFEGPYDIAKLRDYIKTNPNNYTIRNIARRLWDTFNKMQYFFMLSVRTRFHGMNVLTAPLIIWATVGAEKAGKAIMDFPGGMYLSAKIQEAMYQGSNVGTPTGASLGYIAKKIGKDPGDAAVAFKTATGKPYTWGDLRDLAIKGGITKSEAGFAGGREALKPLADEIAGRLSIARGGANAVYDSISSIAPLFDGAWRTSVMIGALKAGRTEQDAIKLAREALFDYGRMTAFEQKYIGSWFMYYSFFRASVANALVTLVSNPSRLANQLKIAKGLDPFWGTASESEDNSLFYRKEYLQSRARIGFKRGGNTNENYDIYAPPLPLIDSYVLLAKILGFAMGNKEFGFGDYLVERASPMPKIALGISRKQLQEIYGRGYIDPRHIAWLRATGTWDTFLSFTCGNKTRPTPVDPKEGDTAFFVENGFPKTWSFEGNQKAIDAYITLLLFVQASGAQLAINDYAFVMDDLGGLDLPQEGIELSWQPGEMIGAATYVKNSGTSIVRASSAGAQDAAKMKVQK